MSPNIPVLPVAGSTLLRASLSLLALVTHWLKRLNQARRHRREARVLAALDRHMLADLGITRADVNDAFSEPFWQDPTVLLSERASERRRGRRRRRGDQTPGTTAGTYAQPAHRRALPML